MNIKKPLLVSTMSLAVVVVAAFVTVAAKRAMRKRALLEGTRSDDPEKSYNSMLALVEFDPHLAVPYLLTGDFSQPRDKDNAYPQLAAIVTYPEKCAGPLSRIITDSTASTALRRKASEVMGLLGGRGFEAAKLLLKHRHPQVRVYALVTLAVFAGRRTEGSDIFWVTADIRDRTNNKIRGNPARVRREIVSLFLASATDGDTDVRKAAIKGMLYIDELEKDDMLNLLAHMSDSESSVRSVVVSVASRIDRSHATAFSLPAAFRALSDVSPLVTQSALDALDRHPGYFWQTSLSVPNLRERLVELKGASNSSISRLSNRLLLRLSVEKDIERRSGNATGNKRRRAKRYFE